VSSQHVRLAVQLPDADFGTVRRVAQVAELGLLDFVVGPELTVLAALAGTTERLGLVGTVDPALSEPFEVSRQLASLQQLSDGRAGWNTANVSAEFVTVVRAFWDSWQPDAVLADLNTGVYADPGRIRSIIHSGERFDVRGMATLPVGSFGHPVLVQLNTFASVTAEELARDALSGTREGFLLAPSDLDVVVEQVIPLLQNRGVFRAGYRALS
jgi:alkanesulfonate monooxygenase SsuD/methylene tetrahydromethanopterin reductase-like flavin-dependent oxidoreductase (luciferase family)